MKLARNGRITLATLIWVGVAIMLTYRGLVPHFENIDALWAKIAALVAALVLGFGKGKFVLRKSAIRTRNFIARRPEKDWFWFSIHPVLYILIPAMIGLGYLVKHFCAVDYPAVVVGLYVGIAVALLIGTRGFKGE